MNTHNNMQLTMRNKYTNDDVHTNDCVVHIVRWACTKSALFHTVMTPHTSLAQVLSAFTLHPWSSTWRILFDSISPFFLFFSFLPFSVYFLHNELFLELDNPIVMASLRYSASEKSEGMLNASHSFTQWAGNLRNAVRRLCAENECTCFCEPIKGKNKTTKTNFCQSTKTMPIGERTWTDIEPQDYSLTDYSVSKKLVNLLRHGSLPREDDGAIEFCRIKDYLQNHFVHSRHWADEKWKSTMAKGGGNKKRFQYCIDPSGEEILYLRALQGHSGRNLIDPSLQDNVLIPDDFFKCIFHVGCAINLHSTTNSGLIPGGQNLSKRQTVFFTSVDPMDKEHRDPNKIDLEAPCVAWYHQKKWNKHQNTVYWVDIKLAQKKGLKFYQTRSNAIILDNTLPAYCIPKAVRMETGEIIYEKLYESPRPPPKISLTNDWMKELGSEVARQAEDNQPNQPNPNPIYRTVRPVVTEQTSRSSAQEIDTRFSLDCKNTYLFERLKKRQRHRQRRRCRSSQNGETRWWTSVPPARGDRHRF